MVRTRPFKKRNIQHLGPYHKSGILKQWFPSRASIRVDFGGFSTIPVKTVFFTREGKLGFQGWGDGGKHMRFNRKTMSIHDNTNKFFRPSWPNILIPHPGTLSQNRAYLLIKRAHSQHLPQSTVLFLHLFPTCWISRLYNLTGPHYYVHWAAVAQCYSRWPISPPPLLHPARKWSLELILGFGTKCTRTQSCH